MVGQQIEAWAEGQYDSTYNAVSHFRWWMVDATIDIVGGQHLVARVAAPMVTDVSAELGHSLSKGHNLIVDVKSKCKFVFA